MTVTFFAISLVAPFVLGGPVMLRLGYPSLTRLFATFVLFFGPSSWGLWLVLSKPTPHEAWFMLPMAIFHVLPSLIFAHRWRGSRSRRADVCQALGLTLSRELWPEEGERPETPPTKAVVLRGIIDGVEVRYIERAAVPVEVTRRSKFASITTSVLDFTRIEASPTGATLDLQARPESAARKLSQRLGRDDVSVGDPNFDRQVWVHGPVREVLVAASHKGRADMVELVGPQNFSIALDPADRAQVVFKANQWFHDRDAVSQRIGDAVRLAQSLSVPAQGVAETLFSQLQQEPLETVRLRLLDALLHEPPPWPHTSLEQGLKDVSGAVRLFAAKRSPKFHADVLETIVADIDAPDALRLDALREVLKHSPPNSALRARLRDIIAETSGTLQRNMADQLRPHLPDGGGALSVFSPEGASGGLAMAADNAGALSDGEGGGE